MRSDRVRTGLRRAGARGRLCALAAAMSIGPVAAGCGVPGSSDFSPVASDQIPFELDASTSTTSSTTLPPTTTVPVSTTTTAPAATTTIATDIVEIVYVAGSRLTVVRVPLAGPASMSQVVAALLQPPSGDIGRGLRLVIPADTEIEVTKEAGVAIVDLPAQIFEDLDRTEHRLVFGQIVLTLTRRPGIGQVRFLLDGEPRGVALPGARTSQPGELLSEEDYVELLEDFVPPATTSTTSTTTTVVESLPPENVDATVPGPSVESIPADPAAAP
jgi:hypothetical protein